MKIKYLGTAAAEGIPAIFCECENCKRAKLLGGKNIRTRSQAIIDNKILIDFPPETYMHYLKYNIPLNEIKTCIITHSHEDHLYADEILNRKNGFSHIADKTPLTLYAGKSGYKMIKNVIEKFGIPETDAIAKEITAFESFSAEGYTILPVKASHDPSTSPLLFVIEKDGKSLFYSHDSSEYCGETFKCLKGLASPIDVVSLDCTEACNNATYTGHLSLERCIKLREKMLKEKIVTDNTVFILNHFSHNGKNSCYTDFVGIAAENGFATSYDGMEFEF